ncbi:hypothetical protein [Streptomyces fulvorobeus]|uniref:Uncharacterized protein n=1 Tax=Streptomyces fulvorobeus TaxID=284028 RepID=A0A7Y9HHV3_9ACTN|nr:hypothetical protein [Streptomyces fulvorobeus]NYE44557.1 hypothetical protein [Streptomyces fulvorobeus]
MQHEVLAPVLFGDLSGVAGDRLRILDHALRAVGGTVLLAAHRAARDEPPAPSPVADTVSS